MQQREITSFNDVIMYQFQRMEKTLLHFHELWKICTKAGIEMRIITDHDENNKLFAGLLIMAIRELERAGLVNVHTKNPDQKISHITITLDGIQRNKDTIYTYQRRMGDNIETASSGDHYMRSAATHD